METTQSSEPFRAHSGALEVRQHDPAGVSDHDVFHVSASIDENSHLSIYFSGNLGKMAGEFLSHDLVGMNPPLVKLLQAVDLAWLETLQVTFDIYGSLL